MDRFFKWYHRVLQCFGAAVWLFLLLYTFVFFFFGADGRQSGLEWLLSGTPAETETKLCLKNKPVPSAADPPPELSELTD